MVIDISGEYWRGQSPRDLAEFLEEYHPGGYPVHQTAQAACDSCAGPTFALEVSASDDGVRRTCASCGTATFMLDSDEYWLGNWDDDEEPDPEQIECPCGADVFETVASFSRRDDRDIRWVGIGTRCTTCGILGCVTDWKIPYSPSTHLLDRA